MGIESLSGEGEVVVDLKAVHDFSRDFANAERELPREVGKLRLRPLLQVTTAVSARLHLESSQHASSQSWYLYLTVQTQDI